MFFKSNPKERAAKYERKGDHFFQKKKFSKALAKYEKSAALYPHSPQIYDKLIEAHKNLDRDWQEIDFTKSLDWTMRKQELENPSVALVHARFAPEYTQIKTLAEILFQSTDEQTEKETIAKILSFEEKATLPLIDLILSLKKITTSTGPKDNC